MPARIAGPRLLLTTDAVGGVWRYSIDLAHGLARRGVGCVLAVLGPAPGPAQREEARGIELVNTGLPLDWTAEDPAALRHASTRLATLASLLGASGVHLHAPALVGNAAWPVPPVVVAHSDVGTWWRALRTGPMPPDLSWRADMTRTGLAHAAAVIAPTAAHAADVQAVYGPRAITVVHNGVAQKPMSGPRDRAVLTAGRLWDDAKGAAVLDRAARGLAAPIRAAGSVQGPSGGCAALPNLQLLGTLDRAGMAHAYAGATVFASAARYEPFGLAVLEAAQAGMRLVLRDTPGFRELWDGVARFVPNESEWPQALRAALDEEGHGGAQTQAGRYTVEAMVAGTLAVHRDLAQGTAPRRQPVSGAA